MNVLLFKKALIAKVFLPLIDTLTPVYLFFIEADYDIFLKKVRLYGICLIIIVFIALLPCSYTFYSEKRPYFGDFAWTPVNPVRISEGAFSEDGRGGLEHYIPKLRLIEYKIEQGDTLWSISRKFEVDPDSIISCNVFSNVHSIHEGDIILVPNIKGIFVNVEESDTIFKYSSKYQIQPDFIMEVNDLFTHTLTPGMKIFLPGVRFSNIERAYALGEAFEKPCRGRLTSRYGYRRDPFTGKRAFHTGIDIANRRGGKVHAAQAGRVVFAGARSRYGYTVIIEHSFGYRTLYGHLSDVVVKRGQRLQRGQVIGYIGNTGRSTGPHLHFEVWLKQRLIDPLTQTNMAIR
ncbi:MAG: M23 family metallopeptidase [Spirochaetota bacterium]|nr:MAG: M23 family metallopeptidase [Spirochaetota bacterium]